VVFALATAFVLPAFDASAAGASDTLAVSVTVASSCSVMSEVHERSLSVRLSCSSAQRSPVLMGNNLLDGRLISLRGETHVGSQSQPDASATARTVTLNF
jgi:hypothetical protein